MAKELVTMSRTEIDRMGVIRKVLEGRLSQGKAGDLLGLGARQVRRLATAYELEGPAGLASKKRGRPSNYRLPEALQLRALELVGGLYADFGCGFRGIWALVPAMTWALIPEDLGTQSERSDGVRSGSERSDEVEGQGVG